MLKGSNIPLFVLCVLTSVTLSTCDNDHDPTPDLKFSIIEEFDGIRLSQATGFTISEDETRAFIVNREINPANGVSSERVIDYDLVTGEKYEYYFNVSDFISKSAHLINNQLVVVGGTYVNIYDLSFSQPPESFSHGLSLSRFGSVAYNGDLFIWGGDLNALESDLIRKWSFVQNEFMTFVSMPDSKTWAEGEIVNNKLYIFGGQEEFDGTPPNDIIFALDLADSTFQTNHLPHIFSRTFTAKVGVAIFVAGHIVDGGTITSKIGTYLTTTEMFSEFSFSTAGIKGNIHQLWASESNVYILFGGDGDIDPITLMKAPL